VPPFSFLAPFLFFPPHLGPIEKPEGAVRGCNAHTCRGRSGAAGGAKGVGKQKKGLRVGPHSHPGRGGVEALSPPARALGGGRGGESKRIAHKRERGGK
jgi:hypothetical protein